MVCNQAEEKRKREKDVHVRRNKKTRWGYFAG